MPFQLHSKKTLITAILATQRPVAFLVGAPLSLHNGIGVPDVNSILPIVRAEVPPFALPEFDAEISGKQGGLAYQAAMGWLGLNVNQDAVNNVIRKSVLKARKPLASNLESGNGSYVDWNIPSGTMNLGELIARGGEKFLGPILTTNFDPLISLAVRNFGGRTSRRIIASDGTLGGSEEDDITTIVHLHGFWRDSETLHTSAQLTAPRSKLKASLKRLLQQRTLIVVAYGGWDDVFTQALIELMDDEQAPLDVLWCFFENDVAQVESRYATLLAKMAPATLIHRFRPFGGIDCHNIFAEIIEASRRISEGLSAFASPSPLAGWELIDSTYLSRLSALSNDELVLYFDGAVPTWRHAISQSIPRREAVISVIERFTAFANETTSCSLQLIRAAGGEGKTTMLLQAASDAARSAEWAVLWRPSPHVRLSAEHVTKLDINKKWLIVVDDAENLVNDLVDCAQDLHKSGRRNIHFLLAARDTDWTWHRGDNPPWDTWLKRQTDVILRELRINEAQDIVKAWSELGNPGLRELASYESQGEQVAALLEAVREASRSRKEGSLFGGLLEVRIGQNGLKTHVLTFLNRLREIKIEGTNKTQFEALLYIAACHAVNIRGLHEHALADLVGVPRDWVQSHVIRPLGEEAAAVQSGGYVYTRHRNVAGAILVVAEEYLKIDIAEKWSNLVKQIIRMDSHRHFDSDWFFSILHASVKLQATLPKEFSVERRKEIALSAAKAAIISAPDRLSLFVDLGKIHRNAKEYAPAAEVFRNEFSNIRYKIDFNEAIRGFFTEWGIAEGNNSNNPQNALANAWLSGIALSDYLEPSPILEDDIRYCTAGLGIAFGRLSQNNPRCPFARARRAVAGFGKLMRSDGRSFYFDQQNREADRIHTPYPKTMGEAIDWLTDGVAQAGRILEDSFLKNIFKSERITFNMVEEFLSPTHYLPKFKEIDSDPPSVPPHSSSSAKTRLENPADERLRTTIHDVAKRAWEAAGVHGSKEDQLQIAKQEALRLFATLSPYVRREVTNHFTSQKWKPLIDLQPKTK